MEPGTMHNIYAIHYPFPAYTRKNQMGIDDYKKLETLQ